MMINNFNNIGNQHSNNNKNNSHNNNIMSYKKHYYSNNRNNNSNNKFTVMATGSVQTVIKSLLLLSPLLLLQFCNIFGVIIKPAQAVAVTKFDEAGTSMVAATTPASILHVQPVEHCVVVLENTEIRKQIGSVWLSEKNPCAIHACEPDDAGGARVTINMEDCGQFYCDVDSELRPQEGSCCGICVRTKCRFNDRLFEIGETWHNKEDCTLLECTQLATGEAIINAYQKSCPKLPPDCEPANIYTENCCQYCNSSRPAISARAGVTESEDIWTEEYYRQHPCARECQANEPPMTCRYQFLVEWYETLSKACFECPHNLTDCERPHCIIADGMQRSITVVNRMMPGPSIEVCENDILIVDVENDLLGESTTIHWHGLHQKDTPYADGVPHISQCPISPHATFRYQFRADNPGTHFWHSHTGMQRGDGVFGALIIRRPRAQDPHSHLYDFDLSEHKMLVQDWVEVPGVSMFASHHHSRGDNKPRNLLINGRGRYYYAIWDAAKKAARTQTPADGIIARNPEVTTKPAITETSSKPNIDLSTLKPEDYTEDVDYLHPLNIDEPVSVRIKQSNEISRLARLAKGENLAEVHERSRPNESLKRAQLNAVPETSTTKANGTEALTSSTSESSTTEHNTPSILLTQDTLPLRRLKRAAENISLDQIPLQVYTVRRGFRYRFRIINAEFLNCPIAISVDNHTMLAINSDGYDFEAVEVGSIVTYAGERFDFILHANQSVGNYWVRLKGLMDCSELFTSAFQVAILRYEDAEHTEPSAELGYNYKAAGIELNVMNRGPGHVDSLTIAELTALSNYDSVPGIDRDALKPVADYKFFVYYDFYGKDNPSFHPGDYYGFNANLSAQNKLYTPQLNHISLKFPSVALLPMRDELDDAMFCNETSLAAQGIDCRKQFCKCHHVLQVPLNSIVEFIIVDEGFTYDANHPFHLHGNAFRVVGLERLGTNVTIEMIKQLDRFNLLKRNLIRPPVKDTVTIPDGGYTIVRFEAYNPGFWLFHCHIEFHAEIGMALILKVGNNDEMVPVPKNFPTCHDYMPDNNEMPGTNEPGHQTKPMPTASTTTTTDEQGKDAGLRHVMGVKELINIMLLLMLFNSILHMR